MNSAVSLTAVVMFADPGKIRDVLLLVRVRMPENVTVRRVPAAIVSKAVIVVVPLTITYGPVAAPIGVVVADGIVVPCAESASNAVTEVVFPVPPSGIGSTPVDPPASGV